MINLKQFPRTYYIPFPFTNLLRKYDITLACVKVTIQNLSQILLQMSIVTPTCILDLLRAKWCNSLPKNSPIISAPHMTSLLCMSTCTLLFSIPRRGSVTWQQPRDWPWRWSQRCTLKEVLKCAFLMPYCEKIQYLSYQCNQGIQKPFVSNLQMGYVGANTKMQMGTAISFVCLLLNLLIK